MNNFLNELKDNANLTLTENGAVTRKSTLNEVYDMFALGGAYRQRSDEDVIKLFDAAFVVDRELALKCLFYLRDARGGQGERRFFRVCFNWLAKNYPSIARKNLQYVAEYGRYDDMWYSTFGTPLEADTLDFIKDLLTLDISCKTPSLLAKWLPSENASSAETKAYARKIREYIGMSSKQYRKTLSYLREKINVLERLMSANKWEEIEFDKIPSQAGLKYRNAFARRDIIAKKYADFAQSNKKVNAGVLYPYEVVKQAGKTKAGDAIQTAMLDKYWDNLTDYFHNASFNGLAVVDVSGSMTWGNRNSILPIDVAISLGLYCAEKAAGPFHNHFITFESNPHLIEIHGKNIVEKVRDIYNADWGGSTNIERTFNLILNTAIRSHCSQEDLPENIIIISDMEFDCATDYAPNTALMEGMQNTWAAAGYQMPKLVFWNVNARNDNIPMKTQNGITFVSGNSPVTYEMIMSGKTSLDLMLDKLNSDRYKDIKA